MPNRDQNTPIGFEVRLIIKDPESVELLKLLETIQSNIRDLARIKVENMKFKKYGLLLSGQSPMPDMLRFAEMVYQLTADGDFDMVIHIGKREAFLLREGGIHDLNVANYQGPPVPQFDDAPVEDPDMDRQGFGMWMDNRKK